MRPRACTCSPRVRRLRRGRPSTTTGRTTCSSTSSTWRSTLNAGSTGFTIFIVGRTGAALTNYGCPVGSGGSAPLNFDNPTAGIDWAFCRGSKTDGFGAGWGGPDESIGFGDVAGVAINQAFQARYKTNKIAWSIDGPNSGTPADTSFPSGTFQLSLGVQGVLFSGTQFGQPFNGDIASVLVYSAALSAPNLASIKSYLTLIWGV